ncbi:MAG TPA: type III-B CRISPR module RAMP protein Cmr6 [Myxococcota bacterium]|nr:type III-B CRISPR module RAMP protein Cmr6 [Myxococcota bacterium]HQK51573.1 type III-B CRISPR module RAMP protein Cmr6 [Myxococcota bacterium]
MDRHPGLWFKVRKTYVECYKSPASRDTLMKNICEIRPDSTYQAVLNRWKAGFTPDGAGPGGLWSDCREMDVSLRLITGMGDRGVFEWGIRLHHTYGMPIIPGSSLKGVVRSMVQARRDAVAQAGGDPTEWDAMACAIFGTTDQAGVSIFHDAWWVPTRDHPTPFVREVMTPHHLQYGSTDDHPAADWDDPTPVTFVTVRGRFFFAVEAGSQDLARLSMDLLQRALVEHGVGAKTRAGYGRFHG